MEFSEIISNYDQLLGNIHTDKNIVIYGAANIAKCLITCLYQDGIGITKVVVTNKNRQPDVIDTIPVYEIGAMEDKPEDTLIIIATRTNFHVQIINLLMQKGYRNIIPINKDLVCSVRNKYVQYYLESRKNEYRLVNNKHDENNHFTIGYGMSSDYKYHWRVHSEISLPFNLSSEIWNHGLLQEYEKCFGQYHLLTEVNDASVEIEDKDYIYAARSHVDVACNFDESSDLIRFVQAGAALTDREICELKDNMGDNISTRNKNYSECTVLYWLWKNVKCHSYIGMCHYRRHFDITRKCFDGLKGQIDVVLATPTITDVPVERYFSGRYIPICDWTYMMQGIKEHSEEIYQTAVKYAQQNFYPPCNLMIMKKEIFQDYCAFAFSVTEYVENIYKRNNVQRQDRYMGFLLENLLAIYIMHHKEELRVAYTDMLYYR